MQWWLELNIWGRGESKLMPLTDRLPLVSCQISKFECNMKQGHRGGNSPLTILYKVQEDLIPAEFVCSPVR